MFPESVKIFTQQQALNENLTLRDTVLASGATKDSIVVFDRGLQSREAFSEFDEENIRFVCRHKNKVNYDIINEIDVEKDSLCSKVNYCNHKV